MRPGEIHLFDFSREYHSVASESAVAGVIIPHDVIGYDPARHPGHMKLTCTTAAGSLLIDAFLLLLDQLPELGKDEASSLADGFFELLRRHAIPGSVDEPGARKFRAERRADMRSYVERRLDDPDFSVEQICRAFHVSVPTVYRDFADAGGVAHYIATRRLDRAFRQLLSAAPNRGQVQETANRCGFDDPGYFSRLFRQHFGVPPSTVLSLGQMAKTPAAQGFLSGAVAINESRFADWLSLI
jgi:AraC-like DNA-binding protein